jgi:hypothetical protein
MSDPFLASGPNPRASEPPITTLEGLKREANTAVIRYFAPVFAIYNELAATAGLPIVRWHARTPLENEKSPQNTGHM